MWNAVSYLHGYDTPTCFDEQLFNVGAQLADNYSTVYDYCNDTGQSACYQLMGSSLISFPEYRYPNPLEFAEKGKNYTCKNGNTIGLMYYPKGSDKSQYWVINGFVNKELLAEWNPVAYTAQEKQQLKQARDYYAKSVEEFNAEKSYYEVEPSYDSLDTIEGGKLSEGIAKGAVDFLNAIRAGGGLNPLEYSEELSADAQCKSTYTVYLSKNKISNPNPHFPPQLDGLSDEYYAKCQSGSGENLFMCGILSTNIIGSISNALDDSYGTGQYYSRGHRYNLLNPSWKYIGVGNTLQQGCHKMTGTQDYDAEVVACATDAIVANANGEHLDEALEVLDYIGAGGDWLKTVTNSYGGFMACMDIEADDEIASKDYYKDLKAYMDAGKVRSTLWNQLPSGASDVLGDDVQGYLEYVDEYNDGNGRYDMYNNR